MYISGKCRSVFRPSSNKYLVCESVNNSEAPGETPLLPESPAQTTHTLSGKFIRFLSNRSHDNTIARAPDPVVPNNLVLALVPSIS